MNIHLQEAKRLFQTERLPFPPIPEEMVARIQQISPWVFGTRSDTPSPYSLSWFVEEVQTRPVEDYVLLGHAGHGVNSWALHYYLVRGSLALFLQTAWGGIYIDNEAAAQDMTVRFAQSQELITAMAQTYQHDGQSVPRRLLIVVSDFYGSRWKRFNSTSSESESKNNFWNESNCALEEVLALVTDSSDKS